MIDTSFNSALSSISSTSGGSTIEGTTSVEPDSSVLSDIVVCNGIIFFKTFYKNTWDNIFLACHLGLVEKLWGNNTDTIKKSALQCYYTTHYQRTNTVSYGYGTISQLPLTYQSITDTSITFTGYCVAEVQEAVSNEQTWYGTTTVSCSVIFGSYVTNVHSISTWSGGQDTHITITIPSFIQEGG